MLSNNADVANILTNGPIMLVLVKMLRQTKSSVPRVQFLSLIALLIRHSNFFEEDLENSGILEEMLFYISTQNKHAGDSNPPKSPSMESQPSSGWQKGQDDMTQLYALRTIENICGRGAQCAAHFASSDGIRKLMVFEMQNLNGLVKGNALEQQISLNLPHMAMMGSQIFSSMGCYLIPLIEEKNLVPSLVCLIEPGSSVLRGKALLFVALLCKNGRHCVPHFFCNPKLLSVADRLVKEKGSYVKRCLDAFVHVGASSVPGFLESITGDIQQMMEGRHHGPISALSSRAAPKNSIHLFRVVLHFLGTLSFKQRVATLQVLQQLANLMKLAESPFQSIDDLKSMATGHFLPLYPFFIKDEDPIPMYVQKLLVMLIEFNCIKISDILQLRTISQCFNFLLGDLSSANVNNVKLCLALACAPELESKILSRLKATNTLPLIQKNQLFYVTVLLRQALSLIHNSLLEKLWVSEATLMSFLSSSREANVADIASECVIMLLKATPSEGTTEAMILSISILEITIIEAIVSELKNSSMERAADAVFLWPQQCSDCLVFEVLGIAQLVMPIFSHFGSSCSILLFVDCGCRL
ncbi:hypothetical protein RJ641_004194 [Dillenia turbinata]|uniref:Uncharacterized protein n=1 Tax=Dillenia turbinata TaxID=194707 RepID=A0AAN8V9I5_9MAGN